MLLHDVSQFIMTGNDQPAAAPPPQKLREGLPVAAARPRATRRCFLFYDRMRTESVQMKDREGSRLARPPRKTPGKRSREAVALACSMLPRLSAGLGVARGSRECRLLLPRPLAADRRRSTL